MHTLTNIAKNRVEPQQLQKGNTFVRSGTHKQKRQKQTILFLLHQERMFECQNNREMVTNTLISQNRKRSSERLRIFNNTRQVLFDKAVTLTPKFKQHNLSQSKLPRLKKRAKRQMFEQTQAVTPWQQEDSYNLVRPLSSKFLPY